MNICNIYHYGLYKLRKALDPIFKINFEYTNKELQLIINFRLIIKVL